jgi:hypothetical protein
MCLQDKLSTGEWTIAGTRKIDNEFRFDIAVLDANQNILLAVEIKSSRSYDVHDAYTYANAFISKKEHTKIKYFMLATLQECFVFDLRDKMIFDRNFKHISSRNDVNRIARQLSIENELDVIDVHNNISIIKRHINIERIYSILLEDDQFINKMPSSLSRLITTQISIKMEYKIPDNQCN